MRYTIIGAIFLVFLLVGACFSQESSSGIDPEALIAQIIKVESEQQANLHDIIYDAEYVEGETKEDGNFEENVRFVKRIYIKYLPDSALFHEEYLQCYEKGKQQDSGDCQKTAAERLEKKRRRNALDISFPMIRPFTARQRHLYTITYQGIASTQIENRTCHKFHAVAIEPADSLINGDYYFESEGFHLVRVDFTPSKLVRRSMFKMSEMNMSLAFAPTADGFWLPQQFKISMKARAMWVIGIKVKGTEDYRNPVINQPIDPKIFEATNVK